MFKGLMCVVAVSAVLVVSTLAVARDEKPQRASVSVAKAGVVANRRVVLTTPAARAADRSRRLLLERARRVPAPGMTRDAYLKLMHAVWAQDLDANSDGTLAWQAGTEPLKSGVENCVVVQYTKQAATKEKDRANPGKWIETPETWVPADWLTYAEVLATTKVEGKECEVIGTRDEWRCLSSDGKTVLFSQSSASSSSSPLGSLWPKIPCKNAWGMIVPCPDKSKKGAEAKCAAKGGSLVTLTKMDGCEKWQSFGPETLEAFLAVAEQNFDSEDHDGNGRIDAGEGQHLCRN